MQKLDSLKDKINVNFFNSSLLEDFIILSEEKIKSIKDKIDILIITNKSETKEIIKKYNNEKSLLKSEFSTLNKNLANLKYKKLPIEANEDSRISKVKFNL